MKKVMGRWKLGKFETIHVPEHREKIRFINSGGKLENKLHRTVPELAADAVGKALAEAAG
jgi:alkylresorcinol/alkylpyrone synthase